MAKKIRVGILFGGRSGEHEVSLLSAASILKAIDRKKFEVVPIGIAKSGQWLTGDGARALLAGGFAGEPVALSDAASGDVAGADVAAAKAVSALVARAGVVEGLAQGDG